MPDPGPNPAADWLLSEYEDTAPDHTEIYDEDSGMYLWPDYIQAVFQLKSDIGPGTAMRVIASDYHDPGRWWL